MLKRNIPSFAVIRLPAIALQALFEPSEANAAVCEAREARNARGEAREREILELRAKCHVRFAWLIRRKLCRLASNRMLKSFAMLLIMIIILRLK